jgi:hypothetical protein
MADLRISRGAWLNAALVALAIACLLYEHGIATGSRLSFGFIYLLVLLRSGVLLSMGFLLGNMSFSAIDLVSLAIIPIYLIASALAGWPGLIALSFVGIAGGVFIGIICGLSSRYHRWR